MAFWYFVHFGHPIYRCFREDFKDYSLSFTVINFIHFVVVEIGEK